MNTSRKTAALAAAALLGVTGAAGAAEYANVVSATPVTSSVPTPRQQCVDGERYVQQQPSGGGALIGAIIGGVVGNQFGHGAGRAAATGLGVVAGSAIGNQAELNNGGGQAVPTRHCRTVSTYENRVVGYDVVYEYNGQRYTTQMASDPGPRLAIDVRPAGGNAPLDRVGPPVGSTAVPPAYAQPYGQQPYNQPAYVDPGYVEVPSAYYAPGPVYYAPRPSYYYAPPVIGIGFYGGHGGHGWRHGHRRWH